jgi:hypothetical protein
VGFGFSKTHPISKPTPKPTRFLQLFTSIYIYSLPLLPYISYLKNKGWVLDEKVGFEISFCNFKK